MMNLSIKALRPELIEDYFDFFDHRAFADGSPFYPCYCNAFNMSREQIEKDLFSRAKAYGEGSAGWKRALRDSAWAMVLRGAIQGYLAYDGALAIGWCNANDRLNYYRVGAFNLDNVPQDAAPSDCPGRGFIKSIVCFEISPAYRGMGIAGQLLKRVCMDAAEKGYSFVEAYPMNASQDSALSFTGPFRLYEKAGFKEYDRMDSTVIMRKALNPIGR